MKGYFLLHVLLTLYLLITLFPLAAQNTTKSRILLLYFEPKAAIEKPLSRELLYKTFAKKIGERPELTFIQEDTWAKQTEREIELGVYSGYGDTLLALRVALEQNARLLVMGKITQGEKPSIELNVIEPISGDEKLHITYPLMGGMEPSAEDFAKKLVDLARTFIKESPTPTVAKVIPTTTTHSQWNASLEPLFIYPFGKAGQYFKAGGGIKFALSANLFIPRLIPFAQMGAWNQAGKQDIVSGYFYFAQLGIRSELLARQNWSVSLFLTGGVVTGTLSGREAQAFYLPIAETGVIAVYKISQNLNLASTLSLGYIASQKIPYYYALFSLGVGTNL
ncbi:MAG: hypothetical protein LDLANPLL_02280 [Turneriella sp.]|nr:hypothetical protein [Turneriella sp.]